jgi:hypothetical protein
VNTSKSGLTLEAVLRVKDVNYCPVPVSKITKHVDYCRWMDDGCKKKKTLDVNSEIHVPVDTGVRKLGKLESCCRISVNVAKEALVVASIGDLGASTRLLEGGLAT